MSEMISENQLVERLLSFGVSKELLDKLPKEHLIPLYNKVNKKVQGQKELLKKFNLDNIELNREELVKELLQFDLEEFELSEYGLSELKNIYIDNMLEMKIMKEQEKEYEKLFKEKLINDDEFIKSIFEKYEQIKEKKEI